MKNYVKHGNYQKNYVFVQENIFFLNIDFQNAEFFYYLFGNDWPTSGYATKQLGDDAFGQKRSLNLKILASIHH